MPKTTPNHLDAPQPTCVASEVLSNAELVQLRVRVVALENLVISLLAAAPAKPTLANKMTLHIFTPTWFYGAPADRACRWLNEPPDSTC